MNIFCNKTVPALRHKTASDNFNALMLGQFYYKILMLKFN